MNKAVNLKCQRCGYEWTYTGLSDWYASCPMCRTSVSIKKQVGGNNVQTTEYDKNR